MSGHSAVAEVDVVATTRRRWSAAERRTILAEADADGAVVSEVARRHGVSASLLFRWRHGVFWQVLPVADGEQRIALGQAQQDPGCFHFNRGIAFGVGDQSLFPKTGAGFQFRKNHRGRIR